jgi:dihydrofolate reductase
MRKLIVTNIVSLDGQYEGPGGNVMALPMDQAFDAHNAERLRAADVLLLGRRTFQMFQGFWPQVAGDPAASVTNREISRLNGAIQKLVVSDTLAPDPEGAWHATSRIVRRAEAHRELADLKRAPGKDILVFGSHVLWNDLLAAGLVDELQLMVGNVVLGAGSPAFIGAPASSRPPLTLLETRRWEGSENVLLRYGVGRG